MVLTQTALDIINTVSTRIAIAAELGCGEQTIINNIKWNKNDGPLTKASALKVIREKTGLADSDILTEEPIKTTA